MEANFSTTSEFLRVCGMNPNNIIIRSNKIHRRKMNSNKIVKTSKRRNKKKAYEIKLPN